MLLKKLASLSLLATLAAVNPEDCLTPFPTFTPQAIPSISGLDLLEGGGGWCGSWGCGSSTEDNNEDSSAA